MSGDAHGGVRTGVERGVRRLEGCLIGWAHFVVGVSLGDHRRRLRGRRRLRNRTDHLRGAKVNTPGAIRRHQALLQCLPGSGERAAPASSRSAGVHAVADEDVDSQSTPHLHAPSAHRRSVKGALTVNSTKSSGSTLPLTLDPPARTGSTGRGWGPPPRSPRTHGQRGGPRSPPRRRRRDPPRVPTGLPALAGSRPARRGVHPPDPAARPAPPRRHPHRRGARLDVDPRPARRRPLHRVRQPPRLGLPGLLRRSTGPTPTSSSRPASSAARPSPPPSPQHPCVFLTATAPSFGPVHSTRAGRDGHPRPCRPRRLAETCPHGRTLRCSRGTRTGIRCSGSRSAWTATTTPARSSGTPTSPSCGGAPSPGSTRPSSLRGTRLVRQGRRDAGPRRRPPARPDPPRRPRPRPRRRRAARRHGRTLREVPAPPPSSAGLPQLRRALEDAFTATTYRTPPHPDHGRRRLARRLGRAARPPRRPRPRRHRPLPARSPRGRSPPTSPSTPPRAPRPPATPPAASPRTTSPTPRRPSDHVGRLIDRLLDPRRPRRRRARRRTSPARAVPDRLRYGRLRRWAHMLGFGGHFSTKSRRYSTTLGALRRVASTGAKPAADAANCSPDATATSSRPPSSSATSPTPAPAGSPPATPSSPHTAAAQAREHHRNNRDYADDEPRRRPSAPPPRDQGEDRMPRRPTQASAPARPPRRLRQAVDRPGRLGVPRRPGRDAPPVALPRHRSGGVPRRQAPALRPRRRPPLARRRMHRPGLNRWATSPSARTASGAPATATPQGGARQALRPQARRATVARRSEVAQEAGEWVDPALARLSVGEWSQALAGGLAHLKP